MAESEVQLKEEPIKAQSLSEQIKQSLWTKYQGCLKAYYDLDFEIKRGNKTLNPNKLAEFQAKISDFSLDVNPKVKLFKDKNGDYVYPYLYKGGVLESNNLSPSDSIKALYELPHFLEKLGVSNITSEVPETEADLFNRQKR